MSLEYDDSIILVFTPDDPELIPGLEDFGEFIRDTATVNIIDDDSKYCIYRSQGVCPHMHTILYTLPL